MKEILKRFLLNIAIYTLVLLLIDYSFNTPFDFKDHILGYAILLTLDIYSVKKKKRCKLKEVKGGDI